MNGLVIIKLQIKAKNIFLEISKALACVRKDFVTEQSNLPYAKKTISSKYP